MEDRINIYTKENMVRYQVKDKNEYMMFKGNKDSYFQTIAFPKGKHSLEELEIKTKEEIDILFEKEHAIIEEEKGGMY